MSHIDKLNSIVEKKGNITEVEANSFISIIQDKYPNGAWDDNENVRVMVLDFEMYLKEVVKQPWTTEKLRVLSEAKKDISNLAVQVSKRPQPRPANLNTTTPSTISVFKTIDSPKFESAIKKLQKVLIEKGHIPGDPDPIDGIAGNETYKATIAYMIADPKDFQKSLNSYYGTTLKIDGDIGPNTLKVLKDCTGMEINEEMLLPIAVAAKVKEDIDTAELLRAKSISELINDLNPLSDTREDTEKRNMILGVLARKFQQANIVVFFNTQNKKWELQNNDGSDRAEYSLGTDDIQAIALIGTLSNKEQAEGVSQIAAIPAIFDAVIKEFKLQNVDEGRDWVHNDMKSDTSGYAGDKQKNRKAFVDQIDPIIKRLKRENADPKIQAHTRLENQIQLQRLQVLRAKMINQDSINPKVEGTALAISGSALVKEFYFDTDGSPKGDIIADIADGSILDKITGSGLFPVAVVFGIASIFFTLPKWLKYPSWAILLATFLKGPFKGLMKHYGGDKLLEKTMRGAGYDAAQAGPGGTPKPGKIQEFFARVGGVDNQFSYGYATILDEHDKHDNGEGKNTFTESKLETIFKYAAQDNGFLNKTPDELRAGKSNPNSLFNDYTLSHISNLTLTERQYFIDFVLAAEEVSVDTNVRDILSEGTYNPTLSTSQESYIPNDDKFNTRVNTLVEQISGVDIATESDVAADNPRGQVQKILAETTSILPDMLLSVKATKYRDISTKLEALPFSGEDKVTIAKIVAEYTGAAISYDFLGKSEQVTSAFPGSETFTNVVNGASEMVGSVVAYFGWSPRLAPGTLDETTPADIEALISDAENILTQIDSIPNLSDEAKNDFKKKISLQQNLLNGYLSESYRKLSTDKSLDSTLQNNYRQKSLDHAVGFININAVAALSAMQEKIESLAPLSQTYATLPDYAQVMYTHGYDLSRLVEIAKMNNSKFTSPESKLVHAEALKANTILNTFSDNIRARAESLKGKIPTTVRDFDDLAVQQTTLDSIRAEMLNESFIISGRNWLHDNIGIPNNQTLPYNSTLSILGALTGKTSTELGWADPKTDLDTAQAMIDARTAELVGSRPINITPPSNVNNLPDLQTYITAVQAMRQSIKDTTPANLSAKRDAQLQRVEAQISTTVALFITKLADPVISGDMDRVNDLIGNYQVMVDAIGNGGNDGFDAAVDEKIKANLLNISISKAPDSVKNSLLGLLKTMQENKINTISFANMLKNDSTTMQEVVKQVEAIIQVQQKILARDSNNQLKQKLVSELEASKRVIIGSLEGNIGIRITQYIKTKGKSITEYINALLQS